MENCAKCNSDSEEKGYLHHVGGESFYLCKFCTSIMEKMPANMMNIFLKKNSSELPEIKSRITKVDYHMLNARERRASGKLVWM